MAGFPKEDASEKHKAAATTEPAITQLDKPDIPPVPLAPSPEPLYSAFSKKQKRWISYAASYAAMFSGLSTFIYYPAIVPLSKELSSSVMLINLTITAYLVVAGIAPAFMGDMADQTGRRPVYLLTFSLYVGANIGLALQKSYPALFVLRMLQSAGSSATFSIAYGVIADIASPAERGSFVGTLILFTNTAPSLGPVLGGILAEKLGWRWIFWFLVILSGTHLVILVLLMPETSRKIVDDGSVPAHGINRAILFPTKHWKPAKAGVDGSAKAKRKFHIPNPFTSIPVLFHKSSLFVILVGSIYYTLSRSLGASLSTLCIDIYDLNYLEAGFVYLPTGIGGMISSYTTGKLLDRDYKYVSKKLGREFKPRSDDERNAEFPIEKTRLRKAWYLLAVNFGATLGYGWALYKRAHIAVPLVMQFITGLTFSSMFTICGTLLTDLNPHRSATAQASYNLVRCVGAGGGVAALQAVVDAVGVGWCFTIYGALGLATLPVLLILHTRGMKWRAQGSNTS